MDCEEGGRYGGQGVQPARPAALLEGGQGGESGTGGAAAARWWDSYSTTKAQTVPASGGRTRCASQLGPVPCEVRRFRAWEEGRQEGGGEPAGESTQQVGEGRVAGAVTPATRGEEGGVQGGGGRLSLAGQGGAARRGEAPALEARAGRGASPAGLLARCAHRLVGARAHSTGRGVAKWPDQI